MIKIKLPIGNVEYRKEVSPFEIAKNIFNEDLKDIVSAIFNGEKYDLHRLIKENGELSFVKKDEPEGLRTLNHTTAHVMAQAIKNLYPEAKFGVGPAIEEGFYYDFALINPISSDELEKIEKEMKQIIKRNEKLLREEITNEEALELFKNDPYKLELIEELIARGKQITVYRQENFVDLCAGDHVAKTGMIKAFKLLSLAGAYWRGDSNNSQLQRIYGVAFFNKKDLKTHLEMLENRKQYDHRKLGKQLKLFHFAQETGQGLPIWLPNGFKVRKVIADYIYEQETELGYEHVLTPDVGIKKLYEISGHWEHYADSMFPVMERDGEQFILRPMTCPHHCVIYNSEIRSYRDLPIKIAEFGTQHRYEASGALIGLERVRTMNLSDAHLFIREDQIDQVIEETIQFIAQTINKFNLEIDYIELALHDPKDKEKYHSNDQLWNQAEAKLREILNRTNFNYVEKVGEAAFYGPKIDVQVKTIIGHTITMSTIQLDFLLPERFDLNYIDHTGNKVRPVMIHRGLIGTFERFMAILVEQSKGVLPYWLAPTQAVIIPISIKSHDEYATEVYNALKKAKVRIKYDDSNEKISYKIRQAQISKIPYQIIVGDKEVQTDTVTIRKYGEQDSETMTIEQFLKLHE